MYLKITIYKFQNPDVVKKYLFIIGTIISNIYPLNIHINMYMNQ